MSREVLDEKMLEKANKRLSSIRHKIRIEIIKLLSEMPNMSTNQMQTKLNITEQDLCHHLKILRFSGILDIYTEHKQKYYSINPTKFAELLAWIDSINN